MKILWLRDFVKVFFSFVNFFSFQLVYLKQSSMRSWKLGKFVHVLLLLSTNLLEAIMPPTYCDLSLAALPCSLLNSLSFLFQK